MGIAAYLHLHEHEVPRHAPPHHSGHPAPDKDTNAAHD
jgi:hypothetical protein